MIQNRIELIENELNNTIENIQTECDGILDFDKYTIKNEDIQDVVTKTLKYLDLENDLNIDAKEVSTLFEHLFNNSILMKGQKNILTFKKEIEDEVSYYMDYPELVSEARKKFMEPDGIASELLSVVWHPQNINNFKYLEPDMFQYHKM